MQEERVTGSKLLQHGFTSSSYALANEDQKLRSKVVATHHGEMEGQHTDCPPMNHLAGE